MTSKVCVIHTDRAAFGLCLHSSCSHPPFFCESCLSHHSDHCESLRDIQQITALPSLSSLRTTSRMSDTNTTNNKSSLDSTHRSRMEERREMQQLMRSTMDAELKSDRTITEPEELKDFLSAMEERITQRMRQVRGHLMQTMIEFNHRYHLPLAAVKQHLRDGIITQKDFEDYQQHANSYLGLPVRTLDTSISSSLTIINAISLKRYENYHQLTKDAAKQIPRGMSTEKPKVSFKVSPFYEPTSKIEFSRNNSIIKVHSQDEAIVSTKPLSFTQSYQLNFSISPNGDTPTFGVMLVKEDCLQGEICFMHDGQISFVSDLNEDTASTYLMKQKGMIVRPAHDIFWIDVHLQSHTLNVYDEQRNMFFQLDTALSPIEPHIHWYLAFHLYDITLQIL